MAGRPPGEAHASMRARSRARPTLAREGGVDLDTEEPGIVERARGGAHPRRRRATRWRRVAYSAAAAAPARPRTAPPAEAAVAPAEAAHFAAMPAAADPAGCRRRAADRELRAAQRRAATAGTREERRARAARGARGRGAHEFSSERSQSPRGGARRAAGRRLLQEAAAAPPPERAAAGGRRRRGNRPTLFPARAAAAERGRPRERPCRRRARPRAASARRRPRGRAARESRPEARPPAADAGRGPRRRRTSSRPSSGARRATTSRSCRARRARRTRRARSSRAARHARADARAAVRADQRRRGQPLPARRRGRVGREGVARARARPRPAGHRRAAEQRPRAPPRLRDRLRARGRAARLARSPPSSSTRPPLCMEAWTWTLLRPEVSASSSRATCASCRACPRAAGRALRHDRSLMERLVATSATATWSCSGAEPAWRPSCWRCPTRPSTAARSPRARRARRGGSSWCCADGAEEACGTSHRNRAEAARRRLRARPRRAPTRSSSRRTGAVRGAARARHRARGAHRRLLPGPRGRHRRAVRGCATGAAAEQQQPPRRAEVALTRARALVLVCSRGRSASPTRPSAASPRRRVSTAYRLFLTTLGYRFFMLFSMFADKMTSPRVCNSLRIQHPSLPACKSGGQTSLAIATRSECLRRQYIIEFSILLAWGIMGGLGFPVFK